VIYLYWYLGIGAVVLIFMVAYHKLTKQKDDNLLSDILADLRPERKKLWFRLLNDVLGPALVGTLIVPFWPVFVFFKVKELFFGQPARGAVDEPEFAVSRDDLQTQLSIQEIEQREMVFDPLGAAPNVPFGHLNTAWKQFCEGMEPHDGIWSFTAHWTSLWDRKDLRQGYAIVRDEEVGRHFVTIWKDVEEGAGTEAVSGEKTEGFSIPAWLRKQAD
jgi:hypothetical protein